MSTVSIGVLADWTARLTSVQAELQTFLRDAEPLLAARRSAVAQLAATADASMTTGCARDEPLAFLEAILDIEELARELHRTLNIW